MLSEVTEVVNEVGYSSPSESNLSIAPIAEKNIVLCYVGDFKLLSRWPQVYFGSE